MSRPTGEAASPPLVLLLMGVAGSGKSTIGKRLAGSLGWPFHDADDFHPPANVEKMSAGIPLNDEDRRPWLASIRAAIEGSVREGRPAVFTCSALRHEYRRTLMAELPQVRLIHLVGDYTLIRQRLESRSGHFMKPAMLESQFAALETPADALTVAIDQPPEAIVQEIRSRLSL